MIHLFFLLPFASLGSPNVATHLGFFPTLLFRISLVPRLRQLEAQVRILSAFPPGSKKDEMCNLFHPQNDWNPYSWVCKPLVIGLMTIPSTVEKMGSVRPNTGPFQLRLSENSWKKKTPLKRMLSSQAQGQVLGKQTSPERKHVGIQSEKILSIH